MNTHTLAELKQRQALPLEVKVLMSKQRIREWIDEFGEDGVYVSFSGGKDSTVLLHLVREDFPNVKAMFVDTGLEYPEVRAFAMAQEDVDVVRPKLTFKEVIKTKGYPFIGKEVSKNIYYARRAIEKGDMENIHLKKMNGELKDENGERSSFNTEKYKFMVDAPYLFGDGCCAVMKKSPAHAYEKATGRVKITGQMADESRLRMQKWLRSGCNAFDAKRPTSNPMSFWTEQDVLNYIKINKIPIAPVYGAIEIDYEALDQEKGQMTFSDLLGIPETFPLKTTGCSRTGCMFCGFGCHLEKESRFVKMKETHPQIYDYIMRPESQGGLNYKEIIDWLNEHGNLNIKY